MQLSAKALLRLFNASMTNDDAEDAHDSELSPNETIVDQIDPDNTDLYNLGTEDGDEQEDDTMEEDEEGAGREEEDADREEEDALVELTSQQREVLIQNTAVVRTTLNKVRSYL